MKNLKTDYQKILAIVVATLLFLLLLFPVKSYLSNRRQVKVAIDRMSEISVDKNILLAIAKVESGYSQNKQSHKQAIGIFQIKQQTFDYVVDLYSLKNCNIYNATDNVKVGCLYYEYLYNKFLDEDIAIIAYNAGEGNVKQWLNDERYSPDGVTIDYIPFKETRDYLKKVRFHYKILRKVERWTN